MNKKMLCRVILTPVTESEDGVMDGGFADINALELIGEIQPRNAECKNPLCPNLSCQNGYCTNGDCRNGYCTNKDCINGECTNKDCSNKYCINPDCATTTPTSTSTSTSTSTATGTSRKVGSLTVDGLV